MAGIPDFINTAKAVLDYSAQNSTDILCYKGAIERAGYDKVCKIIPKSTSQNCLFFLNTYGGDPDAGYRIARALSHHYDQKRNASITVFVTGMCKSAGTLICIGGDKLVIADCGELGPLDVQVQKADEMFQRSSGLDIIRGLKLLQNEALGTFEDYMLKINYRSGLSTKYASDISTNLTIGLFEPIYAQIDPIKLGDMQAALNVGTQYGQRLNERFKNLKPGALEKLVHNYPSHGFVIDRKEARSLFERVDSPSAEQLKVAKFVDYTSSDENKVYDVVKSARILLEVLAQQNMDEGLTNASEGTDHEQRDAAAAAEGPRDQDPGITNETDE